MRFPPSLLDEIRARLPVSQVVGRRVKLKRNGREFTGLSPFKDEKTPSFTVNDQKGFYHCFATSEHGDIFSFLTSTEGLSFPEAVERLAEEAGVEMPKASPQAEAREAQSVTLRRITEESCRFFEAALAGPQGQEARAYLERRGLSAADIERFRLGYAPHGRHQLKEHLAAKGFRADDMAASGMLIAGPDIAVSYDRFRNRLIFPIADLRDQVIAFGGRALAPDQQPKYLNSPETPLFHKGSVLFNAAPARKAAHESGEVIVAEGYMDVIAFHRAGFVNAVAPLGTALTVDQLKMIWRMADEPVLCFDGDLAGLKAAHRAVETVLPLLVPGKSLAFVFLPDGLDPDDLLRQKGADAVREALGKREMLIDVLWNKELASGTWQTPEKRAELEERLKALVETIANPLVRKHYDIAARNRLWQHFFPKKTRKGEAAVQTETRGSLADKSPRRVNDAILIRMLLDNEEAISQYYEEIYGYDFYGEDFNHLKQRILDLFLSQKSPIKAELLKDQYAATVLGKVIATAELQITRLSDEKRDQIINNFTQFFDDLRTSQNDEQARIAIFEAANSGDEAEWLSSLPALLDRDEENLPKNDLGGAQHTDKNKLNEMVKIAMQRVANVGNKGR